MRYAAVIRRLGPAAVFEARGEARALEAAMTMASLVLPGEHSRFALRQGDVRVLRLGPRRAMVWAPAAREEALERSLRGAFAATEAAVVANLSDLHAGFEITGPGAVDVLKQGVALDLRAHACPVGFASGTEAWGIGIVLARTDAQTFAVLVDRALAGYLEGWLATANGEESAALPGTMTAPPASYRPA